MTSTTPTTRTPTTRTPTTRTSTRLRTEEYDVLVEDDSVGDLRLHVREVGPADGSPLLFLHGIMGHRRDWDVLIDHMGGRGHRVVALDQRGHGRSDWAASYRVADMATDAIAVIEQLGLAPLPIVGHSMGAMVASMVAGRRPDLVDCIVLVDIVPESLETEFALQMPEMFHAMAASTYDAVDDAVAEWQEGNPLARPDLLRNYVAHALTPGEDGRLRWGFDARGLRSFIDGVTPDELREALDRVQCPSLVVRGEHSPVTTPELAEAVARRLGRATVVEIAGGGHDLGVEQPEAVTGAVTDFLTTR